MSDERVRVLVAAGAAGGVSAAFNAPLAGVFFALEVILQRFTTRGFATVVVSAVTSSVIWRTRYGNASVLSVPQFGLQSPVELGFYVVLGLLAAGVALTFVRTLYWFEDRFDSLPILADVKPAIGGILLGGLGIATVTIVGAPLIYGSGLLGMDMALAGSLAPWALLFLLAAKTIGTSLTLGSGAPGGVFAPSLFIGAMLGGVFGQGLEGLFTGLVAPSGAYAMVGMAAVFAATAQAPISAILILFEMTNDYRIILPLMLACIVATTLYSIIQRDSIYLVKLRRKGIELREGRERHLLERIGVTEALIDQLHAARTPPNIEAALDWMRRREAGWMVCTDERGRFVGLLTRERAESIGGDEHDLPLSAIIDTDVIPLIAEESLDEAFAKMARRGLSTLPVISDLASRRVIGAVTRESLSATYWRAVEMGGSPER
jgi:CIC family chloride channel protein